MFLTDGGDDYHPAADGGTLRTTSTTAGSRAAHFEYTVPITDTGPVYCPLP